MAHLFDATDVNPLIQEHHSKQSEVCLLQACRDEAYLVDRFTCWQNTGQLLRATSELGTRDEE